MKRTIIIGSGLLLLIVLIPELLSAQEQLGSGSIHGNFQSISHYYIIDPAIDAEDAPEVLRMNSFANIIYSNQNFTAGLRFESYQNPILGFDANYEGTGIPYRFAAYKSDEFEITVGNFYEQFGSGLILRAYEERNLGYDNAFDGIRIRYALSKGIMIKGLIGKQRFFWGKGEGIVRAVDGEVLLNDAVQKLNMSKTRFILGGSFVSKYQEDKDPIFKLPENVGAFATRLSITRDKFSFYGEYAYKINDPVSVNNFIYKPGEALYLTANYVQKGLGISLAAKRIDNMDFRSDRSARLNMLLINFIPELTRQHIYSLATIYPYATQLNGEMGFEAGISYNIKKNTFLGGKYGTLVSLNYSQMNSIDRQIPDDTNAILQSGSLGYQSDFFKLGEDVYFRDVNVEINHKFSKKFKAVFSLVNLIYDIAAIEVHPGEPKVYTSICIAELTYKFNYVNSLRMEMQHLSTRQDEGDWAMLLIEYTIAPKWFFSIMDQYNYGNPDTKRQVHYYNAGIGYSKKANSIILTYGRQKEGILCVGGVCREVPASSGLSLTITSSF